MTLEPTITIGGLATLVAIVGGVVGLLGQQRKIRRENEADVRQQTEDLKAEFTKGEATLAEKIAKLEERSANFMPRSEIEAKIEHEKGNRVAADVQLQRMVEANTRDIVDIKVSVGKVEQKQDGLAADNVEIKALLKELGRDINARLDKLQDTRPAPRNRQT